jgi:hypothetical protein
VLDGQGSIHRTLPKGRKASPADIHAVSLLAHFLADIHGHQTPLVDPGRDGQNDAGIPILDIGLRDALAARIEDVFGAGHGDFIRHVDSRLLVVGSQHHRSGKDVDLVLRCKRGKIRGPAIRLADGVLKSGGAHLPAQKRETRAAAFAPPVLPFHAQGLAAVQGNLGDDHLDEHLPGQDIQFSQYRLDGLVIGGNALDDQRVPGGVRRNGQISAEGACAGFALGTAGGFRSGSSGGGRGFPGSASAIGSNIGQRKRVDSLCGFDSLRFRFVRGGPRGSGFPGFAAGTEYGVQQGSQIFGFSVLDVIDENPGRDIGRGNIQPTDEGFGLFEKPRILSDNHQHVQALDRDDPEIPAIRRTVGSHDLR